MQQVLDYLTANPTHLIIAGVILAVLFFAVVKKVIQLIIVAVIVLALHLAYVTYVSAETRATIKESVKSGAGKVLEAGEKTGERIKK
jgi:flagellar biosynthesis component FlhA